MGATEDKYEKQQMTPLSQISPESSGIASYLAIRLSSVTALPRALRNMAAVSSACSDNGCCRTRRVRRTRGRS